MLPNGRNEYRLTESNGIRMGLGLRWRSEQRLQRQGREHSLESGICCMNCSLYVYPTSLDKRGSLSIPGILTLFICLVILGDGAKCPYTLVQCATIGLQPQPPVTP